MFSYLMPAGSIVLLKGTDRPVMIYGVRQYAVAKNGNKRLFDYLAVPYPEGRISEHIQFTFDHGDIDSVVFTGYDGPERQAFLEFLEKDAREKGQI